MSLIDTAATDAGASSFANNYVERRFAALDLDAIVPSKTNRTNFNEEKMRELTESVKASGVHVPILVRPLPASRLADTFADRRKGAALPAFEIVFGERRYRASIRAGVKTIPAMVQEMGDHAALEAQMIENLQRDDLTEIEEAEGFDRLMKHGEDGTGKTPTAKEIGEKVGRSREYVYARLKLLSLCKAAREAMAAGVLDASKALLIARIPSEARQLQALKDLTAKDYYGEMMGARKAAAHVQERFMLKLGSAKFKITDATLVPAAGDCRSCPKRCGSSKELYPDVENADVCTDQDCFALKTETHSAQLRKQAEENGQTVIEGKDAKKLRPHSYGGIEGHLRLDDAQDSPTIKPLRKLLGKDMPAPILFIDPHDQTATEVLPKSVVVKLLKEKGIGGHVPGGDSEPSEHQLKARAEEKYQLTWRGGSCEALYAAAVDSGRKVLGASVLRLIARELTSGFNSDDMRRIAKLLRLTDSAVGAYAAIEDHILSCAEPLLVPIVLMLLAQRDVKWMQGASNGDSARIDAVAAEVEVDVEAIRVAVKDDLREQAAEKRQKAAAKAAKEKPKAKAAPAPAKPAKGGRKTYAQLEDEAKLDARKADDKTGDLLAAAGDAAAFVINQSVRVLRDGLTGELTNWAGLKGAVRGINGSLIDVRFKGRKAGLVTFPAGQLAGA